MLSSTNRSSAGSELDDSSTASDSQDSAVGLRSLVYSTDRSKKRKEREAAVRSEPPRKRSKSSYNEKYRDFFNETLYHVLFNVPDQRFNNLTTSYVGGGEWKKEDKVLLFHALAKKGRHAHRDHAVTLRTKSELEIRSYMKLLHAAAIEHDVPQTRQGLFDVSTVDAAFEINGSCETALEVAADAIAFLQYRDEEKAEKTLHPQYWLLNDHTVKWVDRCLSSGSQGERIISRELPSAMLLNAKKFLILSKRFFMNSSDLDCNWRTYGDLRRHGSRYPSIMHTAFSDIHALALNKTRYLIQTSLFLANTRIKTEKAAGSVGKKVRYADVIAAIETAGMKSDAREVWARMSRKCNLRVCENVKNKQAWGKEYTFDEVEDDLRKYEYRRGRYRSRSHSRSTNASIQESSRSFSRSTSEAASSTGSPAESAADSTRSIAGDTSMSDLDSPAGGFKFTEEDHEAKQEHQGKLQDAYLEAIDLQASHAEEKHLWGILRKDHKTAIQNETIQLPKKIAPPERTREDFTNWTDWIEYTAPWETFSTLPTKEAFDTTAKSQISRRNNDTLPEPEESGDEIDHGQGETSATQRDDEASETDYEDYGSSEEVSSDDG